MSNSSILIKFIIPIYLLYACSKSNTLISIVNPNYINVKDFGAIGNGLVDESIAFNNAMQLAKEQHRPLYIPSGKYKIGLTLLYDSLEIIGEQQPDQNLNGGSIILGYLNCNNKKYVHISNLGIDSRGQLANQDAALSSGNGIDSANLYQQFNHISLIGDGYMSYKHGILCQTGGNNSIKNITVSNFYHGIAIRSSNITLDSVSAYYCGFTSIVIKSAESFNAHTENVSVNHVNIIGDANDAYSKGGLVLVQSYEDISRTNNILIQNLSSLNGGVACVGVEQVKGIVNGVTVKNCTSNHQGDVNTRACYDVTGGSNITFSNCTANNSLGFGFRATGSTSNIRVENCYENNSGGGPWMGNFSYLQLNGTEIIK
jgi:Pectate lyase superfamily protein